jgi:site-specific DNA-methyltransferase (adenine-specific)
MAAPELPTCVEGDATREEAYARALGEASADVLLTDPPYCLLTRRRKGGDLRDKRDRKIDREPVVRFESVRDYRHFTEGWLPKAIARLTPKAPVVIWTNLLGKEPLLTVAKACGYPHLHGEFIWAKRTREVNANEQLLRVYEVALVLGREPKPPRGPDDPPETWSVVTGYDDEGEGGAFGDHPHHKPFSSVEPLLRAYSRVGQRVLDPFAGSGSIPAAALRLGRKVACMELKPDWAARVTERLRALASAG